MAVTDDGLDLYYYKARFYEPELKRFLQTDPIGYGDGMNMYAYVGGDPVNFSDPSGLSKLPGTNPSQDAGGGASGLGSGVSQGFSLAAFTTSTCFSPRCGYNQDLINFDGSPKERLISVIVSRLSEIIDISESNVTPSNNDSPSSETEQDAIDGISDNLRGADVSPGAQEVGATAIFNRVTGELRFEFGSAAGRPLGDAKFEHRIRLRKNEIVVALGHSHPRQDPKKVAGGITTARRLDRLNEHIRNNRFDRSIVARFGILVIKTPSGRICVFTPGNYDRC